MSPDSPRLDGYKGDVRLWLDALYDGDLDDVFPWTWKPWVTSDGNRRDVGCICTPNGRRADGQRMHTYWTVTGEVWEPHGRLICEAVNAWVRPGWRGRLGRWLLCTKSAA